MDLNRIAKIIGNLKFDEESNMDVKKIIKLLMPPLLFSLANRVLLGTGYKFIEWEYVPEGWKKELNDEKIKGWNVQDILESYKAKWPIFIESLEETKPFCFSHESASSFKTDLAFHNITMSFAYALALSSRCKKSISMLDWGGGIGYYYLISKSLIPDLEIDYHCKDVSVIVEHGRKLLPETHFYTDDSCLTRKYEFVLASASLHYSQDWAKTLRGLASSTKDYIFINNLPIVLSSSSFVFVQRPYRYGYNTEYLGWCLNREEFLKNASMAGLTLVREFIDGYYLQIHNAPEKTEYRGYLFRPSKNME
jgi:putative methyltransferase (TIGR04325 family)